MKIKILAISLFLLAVQNVLAQNSLPVLKDNSAEPETFYRIGEVRGTIRRKAAYLPKPVYPRAALEAGADGAVRVEITIDTEGSVVAAKAVSGHPLLHGVAEETARRTKFRSVETGDADLRETGFLTYTFAIEKYGWLKIGYDLAIIQKAPSLERLNLARIGKAFQPEWAGEIELLGKLADLRAAESAAARNGTFTSRNPILIRKSRPVTRGTVENTIKAEISLPVPTPPGGEQIALSQNLIASLRSRLASDASNLWRFETGVDLVKAGESFRNPTDYAAGAQILRQSIAAAPADMPAETIAALKSLAEIFESGRRTVETPAEIARALGVLFRNR